MKPLPKYNLEKTQIYPLGSNFYESIKDGLKINFENLSLSEQTSYASIGTCFAEEFSTYLKESNIGKYITLEDNLWNSSVFWGRVYYRQFITNNSLLYRPKLSNIYRKNIQRLHRSFKRFICPT